MENRSQTVENVIHPLLQKLKDKDTNGDGSQIEGEGLCGGWISN